MGLAGAALESDPSFPSFPARMSDSEVFQGLVAPYAAVALKIAIGSDHAGFETACGDRHRRGRKARLAGVVVRCVL